MSILEVSIETNVVRGKKVTCIYDFGTVSLEDDGSASVTYPVRGKWWKSECINTTVEWAVNQNERYCL